MNLEEQTEHVLGYLAAYTLILKLKAFNRYLIMNPSRDYGFLQQCRPNVLVLIRIVKTKNPGKHTSTDYTYEEVPNINPVPMETPQKKILG